MATKYALKLCPELVLLPVNMSKYKAVSKHIQSIFREYTDLVEPLALDEAFLDVTDCKEHNGSATFIAETIRKRIFEAEQLTASAGVSCNKFLAKIASGWNKPNGIFVISPEKINDFIINLPVKHLFGVGRVTSAKMEKMYLHTCRDLQKLSLTELTTHFGNFGTQLYYQSRGIDNRQVNPNRIRKSLSVETTFTADVRDIHLLHANINELHQSLITRLNAANVNLPIKSQFVKIKFADFSQTTAEQSSTKVFADNFIQLFNKRYNICDKAVRLIGVGVHFDHFEQQPTLF